MDKNIIKSLIRVRALRHKQLDLPQIKSIITFTETNTKVVLSIPLTNESATLIFREMYESIRQLGDASWRILGYEPLNHEITLDGLKNYNIKYNLKLNLLPRFKKIRNDINYNGFQASVNQAEEIIDFWNKCCKEIINILNSKITSNK